MKQKEPRQTTTVTRTIKEVAQHPSLGGDVAWLVCFLTTSMALTPPILHGNQEHHRPDRQILGVPTKNSAPIGRQVHAILIWPILPVQGADPMMLLAIVMRSVLAFDAPLHLSAR
eukprot:5070646-Amphidinium_carterae.2